MKDFCEVYGVDKREVDYWTRLGLLHPTVLENGYRDYDRNAETELGIILVALMLDYPGSLESKYDMLTNLNEREWNSILDKIGNKHNRINKNYQTAYMIAYNKANRKG